MLDLLRNETFKDLTSIIVYVMFQNQADRLAQFLRMRNLEAESYHAGLPAETRQSVQGKFGINKLKIVVATVAFGMGINKDNVEAVIHYCMPKSPENYIQEIGRAGRDNRTARCHTFLTREDYIVHRSLSFWDGVDFQEISVFFEKEFNTKDQYIAIDIDAAEQKYNLKQNVMSTALSHAELISPESFKFRSTMDLLYTVWTKKGGSIKDLAIEIGFFKEISHRGKKEKGGLLFNVIEVSIAY